MRSCHRRLLVACLAGTAVTAVVVGAPAGAGASTTALHVIKTISTAYYAPLQFAVDGRRVFVADSASSTLDRVGRTAPLATGGDPSTGGDLAGVGVDPVTHTVAYTQSNGDHSDTRLTIVAKSGPKVVASLSAYEAKANPDHAISYGVTKPTNNCVKQALKSMDASVAYRGQVDSHPYAATAIGNGAWAVADAGGNDIVRVSAGGAVSTIAVLPAQPLTISADFAAANGLPACTVGVTYRFEAVPTDVEVGPDGALYVTTLPGGPEGPDSGPGSVYRIGADGSTTRIATGFASATNLAIDPATGAIYVAELGSGQIAKVVNGEPQTVAELTGVVGVEWANGHLYASTAPAVFGGSDPGSVVELG